MTLNSTDLNNEVMCSAWFVLMSSSRDYNKIMEYAERTTRGVHDIRHCEENCMNWQLPISPEKRVSSSTDRVYDTQTKIKSWAMNKWYIFNILLL